MATRAWGCIAADLIKGKKWGCIDLNVRVYCWCNDFFERGPGNVIKSINNTTKTDVAFMESICPLLVITQQNRLAHHIITLEMMMEYFTITDFHFLFLCLMWLDGRVLFIRNCDWIVKSGRYIPE